MDRKVPCPREVPLHHKSSVSSRNLLSIYIVYPGHKQIKGHQITFIANHNMNALVSSLIVLLLYGKSEPNTQTRPTTVTLRMRRGLMKVFGCGTCWSNLLMALYKYEYLLIVSTQCMLFVIYTQKMQEP